MRLCLWEVSLAMCDGYYKECKICGSSIHFGDFCSDCLEKIDPWGSLRNYLRDSREIRMRYEKIRESVEGFNSAFEAAEKDEVENVGFFGKEVFKGRDRPINLKR